MFRGFLMAAAAAVALGSAVAPQPAGAVDVTSCSTITTVRDWNAAAGRTCVLGDKQFTLFDVEIPPDGFPFDVTVNNPEVPVAITSNPGLGTHSVAFAFDPIGSRGELLTYRVDVLDPNRQITQIDLELLPPELAEIPPMEGDFLAFFVKALYDHVPNLEEGDEALALLGSLGDSSAPLVGTTFYVLDLWVLQFPENGELPPDLPVGTMTNIFHQQDITDVPAPATLALIGSALLGLGIARRRRT